MPASALVSGASGAPGIVSGGPKVYLNRDRRSLLPIALSATLI
jgi:hypothetical protein